MTTSHRFPKRSARRVSTTTILAIGLIVVVALGLLFLSLASHLSFPEIIPIDLGSREALANTLARTAVTLISTVFACLFIAIPITANMYTPQLITLFVKSGANRVVLGFFVFSAVHVIWVMRMIRSDPPPILHLKISFLLVIATLLVLLPYLFSVFRSLSPESIISRVSHDVMARMKATRRGRTPAKQEALARGIRNLGNIILRSLDRSDRDVAIAGLEAIDFCAERYLQLKKEQASEWFRINATHFPGLSHEAIALVNRDRIWVEMKLLLQMNRTYAAALVKVPDVISAISRSHRRFAIAAANMGDRGALDLALRYFNNFLREAIKRRDIHAVYDLLYQFRLMALHLWDPYPERVLQIGKRLCYYAEIAEKTELPFALDLIAYDWGVVVAGVADRRPEFDELLQSFLAVQVRSRFQPGIYKARLIAAAQLRQKGFHKASDKIEKSFKSKDADLIRPVLDQLLIETDPYFWEVTDRQQNLDYVPPEIKKHLHTIRDHL